MTNDESFESLARGALLFEVHHGSHVWRLRANGVAEGFPDGAVVVNHAAPLLAKHHALAGEKRLPATGVAD